MSLQELTFVLTFMAPNTELRYSLPGLQGEENRGKPIPLLPAVVSCRLATYLPRQRSCKRTPRRPARARRLQRQESRARRCGNGERKGRWRGSRRRTRPPNRPGRVRESRRWSCVLDATYCTGTVCAAGVVHACVCISNVVSCSVALYVR
jgi:hypothetical protein